jgi:hypothetical protein
MCPLECDDCLEGTASWFAKAWKDTKYDIGSVGWKRWVSGTVRFIWIGGLISPAVVLGLISASTSLLGLEICYPDGGSICAETRTVTESLRVI